MARKIRSESLCGKVFWSVTNKKKYCSKTCRSREYSRKMRWQGVAYARSE